MGFFLISNLKIKCKSFDLECKYYSIWEFMNLVGYSDFIFWFIRECKMVV